MCARLSVQAEAAEACNGLVCETSAKVHSANSDLMCATRSVLQCSNACARATIQSLGGASRQSACACADVARPPVPVQNTSRWGHHDHGNKMIIEGCRRTACIRTTVSMSAVQRTQSVQATPTHRAGHGHAVIMPAAPHTASAASRRLVPTHPRAATTSTREGFTRGLQPGAENFPKS